MPAYCVKSWQASRAVNCGAAGIKPHGLRETPGALDKTLFADLERAELRNSTGGT
jgi:hypothetical protein